MRIVFANYFVTNFEFLSAEVTFVFSQINQGMKSSLSHFVDSTASDPHVSHSFIVVQNFEQGTRHGSRKD